MSSKPARLPQHIRNLLALHSIEFRYDSKEPESWALHNGNPARVGTFLGHLYITAPDRWGEQIAYAVQICRERRDSGG